MPRPPGVTLGTCVRVALPHPDSRHGMPHEGVVIEVVPAGARPLSVRVELRQPAPVARYVVQTWHCRVLRSAAQMVVDAP